MFCFFFFTVPAPTEIYTLSLHDALPIYEATRCSMESDTSSRRIVCLSCNLAILVCGRFHCAPLGDSFGTHSENGRSEEHTSELQSRSDLVCRLLLEKKKQNLTPATTTQL